MAESFPIRWGFGGIGWSKRCGIFSLFVALRFGVADHRKAIGFIIRVGHRRNALFSQRKRPWLFDRIQVRAY